MVSHTAVPEDIAAYGPLCDESGKRTFQITAVRSSGKGLIARFRSIDDRNAAEALVGTKLYVERDRLPPPEEETWYHHDLVGLAAVDPGGGVVGTVLAVQNFGAGDILEIGPAGGGASVLVPFDRQFVPEVDVAGGRIVVVMPVEEEEAGPEEQGQPS